jgi:pimeloyl-ACP methyl ester carboxylesterase
LVYAFFMKSHPPFIKPPTQEGGLPRGPQVDQVPFRSLYAKQEHEVVTDDGWTLVITRYQPIPQPWRQPLLGTPLLLVHGLSQNRHAWTAGEFVKNMLYFGVDVHILELRGHGKSSRALQRDKAKRHIRPLPLDFDYEWDFGAYFLHDVPAAIETIKAVTGWGKIAYCGHSMGGIIGYGLASQRDDLLCMATVGAPADLGAESVLLRLVAQADRVLPAVRSAARLWNGKERALHALRGRKALGSGEPLKPRVLNPNVAPLDVLLGTVYRSLVFAREWTPRFVPKQLRLFNPSRVSLDDVQWLLAQGCEKEPVAVLRTFARWIRKRELKCYRTGFDIRKNFDKIRIPLTIIFGDQDILSGLKSTRPVYDAAQSDYLVWRPVRGNSHVEVTMGFDTRQICYDVKNLIDYALAHQEMAPRLPRLHAAPDPDPDA